MTAYVVLSVSQSIKSNVRRVATLRGVNPLTRLLGQCLPEHMRKRLPVVRPHVALNLGPAGQVLLARPDRCHVAKELYWGRGALDSAQDRHALRAAVLLSGNAASFLDIGAYTGLFALAVARANPRVTCWAYEIVGENFLLLWENVLLNDLVDRVIPCLSAVGPQDGEIRINASQSDGQLASSVALDWSGASGLRVPVKRLDDLHLESPGPVVLKIDVEGFEMEVFDGAQAFLRKHRPDMVCEVLRRAKRVPEMMDLLRSLGYRWYHIREEGFARRDSIVADKLRRDWLLTCRSADELTQLGLVLTD